MSTAEHMQRVLLALATADNKRNVQQRDIEEDEELRIEKALEQLRGQTRAPQSQSPTDSTPINPSAGAVTPSQAPEQGKDEEQSDVQATPVDFAKKTDTVLPVSHDVPAVESVPMYVLPHESDTSAVAREAEPQTQTSSPNASQPVPVEGFQVDQLEGTANAPHDSHSIIAEESNAENEIVLQSRAEVQSISPTLIEPHLSDVVTPPDVTQQVEPFPSEVASAMQQQAGPLPAVTTPSAMAERVDILPAEAKPSSVKGLEEPMSVEVTESSKFQAEATYSHQQGPLSAEVAPSAMEQQVEPLPADVAPSAMQQQVEPLPAQVVAPSSMEQQPEPLPVEAASSAMEQQAEPAEVVAPSTMDQQAEPAEVVAPPMDQQAQPAEVVAPSTMEQQAEPAEVVAPSTMEQQAEPLPAVATPSAMAQLGEPMQVEVTLSEHESLKSQGEATPPEPLESLPITEPQSIEVPSTTEATQSQQEGRSDVAQSQPVVEAKEAVAVPGESLSRVPAKVAVVPQQVVPQQIPKRPTPSASSESKKPSGRSGSNRSQHSGRGGGRGRGSSRRRAARPNSSSVARSRRDFGGAAVSPYADQPPSKRSRRDPGAPPILPNGPAVLIILLGTAQRSYAEYCRSEVDRAGFSVGIRYLDRQPLSLTLSRAFQEGIRFIIIIGKDNEQSNTVSFKIVSESHSEKRQSVVMPLRRAINAMLDIERPQLPSPRRRRYERYPMPREAPYAPTLVRSPPRRLSYPPDACLPPSGPPRYHGYEPQPPQPQPVYESRRYPPARRAVSPAGRRSSADVVPEVQAISNLLSYFDSQAPPSAPAPAPGPGYAYDPHHHQSAPSYAPSSYYKEDRHGMTPLPPLPHSYRSLPPPHRRTEPYDAVYSRR